jgi:N-methylhydantoinase A
MEAEEVAVGVFRIINSQMADLIRKSTIEQGHDPRECILVAYGGAGPTHAVFYGHDIGVRSILVLADSTVFSAEGMLTCDITHTAEASRVLSTPFSDESLAGLTARFEALEQRVLGQFDAEGAPREEVTLARTIGVRFRQQVHTLEVAVDRGALDAAAGERILERFLERYRHVYGEGALLLGGGNEVELHRVVGTRAIEPVAFPEHDSAGEDPAAALKGRRSAWFEPDGFVATSVYDGHALRAGNAVEGPAIIERMGDSVVVPPGFRAQLDPLLTIRLAATAANGGAAAAAGEKLEVAR